MDPELPVDPTSVFIASVPGREENLRVVIKSLYDQADGIFIYLDGYTSIPAWLSEFPKTSSQIGFFLGDGGKFIGHQKGYNLTVDDDLFYPSTYVEDLVRVINAHNRKAVVSYHGKILTQYPVSSYYRDPSIMKLMCLEEVRMTRRVHIVGTGAMGYHSDTIRFRAFDFPVRNMADLWASKRCIEKGVEMVCAKHRAGYIRHQEIDFSKTIYERFKDSDEEQTRIVNEMLQNSFEGDGFQ